MNQPNRTAVWLSFLAIYLIWGSTYLAIKFSVETIPPFLMAGTRHLAAAVLMGTFAWLIKASMPTMQEIRGAALVGILLLFGGNALVSWAVQTTDSAYAALIVSSTPFFLIVFDRFGPTKAVPGLPAILGLIIGFAGVVLLIGPENILNPKKFDWAGTLLLLVATASWALGSIIARYHAMPKNPVMSTTVQMVAGGLFVLLISLLADEWSTFTLSGVSAKSGWSWLYLVIFGSIAGFSAFVYLMRHVSPAKVSTYAYVNPVVAVILGVLFGGEALTGGMIIGGLLILSSVAAITVLKDRDFRWLK